LRIISGKYRGKILQPGKKFSARPTTDFAKESLFNIIQNHFEFEGLKVLDLFAGTGSIGFEFASRESAAVDSVEVNHSHYSFIHKTAKELGFSQMNVYRMDAFAFIKRCTSTYDVIFADPPYDLDGIRELPSMIFERELLKLGGWFILEHSGNYDFHDFKNFREVRKYGSVNFSIFEI
jgi:16S rRNA (guanine966-N2)-methyltransferase